MITGKVKNKMRTNRQNVNVKFWKHCKIVRVQCSDSTMQYTFVCVCVYISMCKQYVSSNYMMWFYVYV